VPAEECTYGVHVFPHDAKVKEWGSSRTRIEQFVDSGLDSQIDARVVTLHSLEDGINATRATLGCCWFDAAETSQGIKALKAYRKEWDEERAVWKDKPHHGRESHAADAFRQLAMRWREFAKEEEVEAGTLALESVTTM
jgi:phage terminase large subunit